eukprot:CAMPEP_0170472622 /NCGR_PEP_ID=MMETSP0123-20130129/14633_1 /TAXON_ID=182087 /ORGANISM="Favella ehrenbergii, Strain Fehren 1" /LENGTH=63 /DNA_ID=CAMNT_0010741037 /DNA_START=191 /DNA_END=382 /DNA_ORIENTATION=+
MSGYQLMGAVMSVGKKEEQGACKGGEAGASAALKSRFEESKNDSAFEAAMAVARALQAKKDGL